MKSRDYRIKGKMMFLFLLLISFFSVNEAGELIIAQCPSSVKFQGDDPIDQHLVPEIFSAAMGFTPNQESDWGGMTITNPFGLAKAAVALYVDGVSSLGKSSNMLKYALNNDEDESVTWKRIRNRINDRYPLENNTLMRVELGQHGDLQQINSKHLDKNSVEDAEFLKEISSLNRYIANVRKSDGIPDLYWFSMKSLHQLSDLKGSQHAGTVEAKEMVNNALLKLSQVYNSAYDGQALVVAIVSDASHTRRTRSLAVGETDMLKVMDDLQDNIYDPDFPVMFNIILWFTVALFLSLLAVSVFIASMDPGRDSIIYRMTSNRMKKDS